MKRRHFLLFSAATAVLALTGCGPAQMIKPEQKVVTAVYDDIEMPDYEATADNVALKTQKWIEQNEQTTFLYTKDGIVHGIGNVEVQTHGDTLKTRFDLNFKVINGHQVEMEAKHFEDQDSPRQGYSDRAYVFHNQVRPAVLELGHAYKDYMDSDTKPEAILEQ